MGSDVAINGQSKKVTEVPFRRVNGCAVQRLDDKSVDCASSNGKDIKFGVEPIFSKHINQNTGNDGDVKTCTTLGDDGLNEVKDADMTEDSSSFEDVLSGDENEETINDASTESQLSKFFDFKPPVFSANGQLGIRKKDLTPGWKKLTQQLSWRCKWAELQVHRLMSEKLKYLNEVEKYEIKDFETAKYVNDVCSINSIPVSEEVLKRKKRRRVEDDLDMTSYISQHSLFSYFGKTKSVAGRSLVNSGPSVKFAHNNSEFKFDDGWWDIKTSCDDFPQKVLWKIEVTMSKFRNLSARVNKVMSEYTEKFKSTVKPPKYSFPKSEDRKEPESMHTSAQHITDRPLENNIMTVATVRSHENPSSYRSTSERTNQLHIDRPSKITESEFPTNRQIEKVMQPYAVSGGLLDNGGVSTARDFNGILVPKRPRNKRKRRMILKMP